MSTTDLPLMSINVAEIGPPRFNSRTSTSPEDDASLAESVKRDGVSTPIKVQRNAAGATPPYILVYGSRRLNAARTVGLASIPALVAPPAPEGAGTQHTIDLMVENARENLARKDLTPYEQARTFAELRKAGMKLADVSSRVGVTPAHVSNLATIYIQADPVVLTEWSKGNKAATTMFLRDLVAKEKDGPKQVALFKEREKQLAAAEEAPDEPEEEEEKKEESSGRKKDAPAASTKYHVEKARYKALIKRLQATKQPAIAVAAVKYLVGLQTKISGIIEDKEEDK